jgi:hypothetical protein
MDSSQELIHFPSRARKIGVRIHAIHTELILYSIIEGNCQLPIISSEAVVLPIIEHEMWLAVARSNRAALIEALTRGTIPALYTVACIGVRITYPGYTRGRSLGGDMAHSGCELRRWWGSVGSSGSRSIANETPYYATQQGSQYTKNDEPRSEVRLWGGVIGYMHPIIPLGSEGFSLFHLK